MKRDVIMIFSIMLLSMVTVGAKGQSKDVSLKIHLSGTYKSKITVQSLSGTTIKNVAENPGIMRGEIATLNISKDMLPGQFVLRFDYQDKASDNPYPSERQIFIGNQNLEMWAKPKALNNPDSTYFQKGEIENAVFNEFAMANGKKREQLGLLQNFLMNYDQPESKFFLLGSEEYEARRTVYNKWISAQIAAHPSTFVSNTFLFQHITPILWKGTTADKVNSITEHYFDGMDFKNPQIIKTNDMKDWMNKYVNIYGERSTTVQIRDSLFALAGKRAIEKARLGHPLVYGWMVDYFYNGFEGFNIAAGIKMLEPYLNDPLCLTTKRQAIEVRLKGMETLVKGSVAPDFAWKLNSGKVIQFHDYKTEAKYKLVMFWSADCQHCKEFLEKFYPWYQESGSAELMDVFAISLDETDTEILAWDKAKLGFPAFKHKRGDQGIRSPEARAYFVLATPTMVLVDAKTNEIVALPESTEDMRSLLK